MTLLSAQPFENCMVSIVIATWNRKDVLRETLTHYQHQSYHNIEILVIDNGSSDDTVEMLKREFPSVRIITLDHNTGVKAYNVGMRSAKGEIIVVSDNDSYLEPTGVEKIVQRFQHGSPQLAVVACEIAYVPQRIIYEWYYHPVDKNSPKPDGYPAHLYIGAGAAIKRRVLEQVGYYPEDFFLYMNEVDLCTRIIGAGYEVRYFPDIVAFHKSSPVARSKGRTRLLSFRNIIWYYWKYFPIHIAFGRSLVRMPFDMIQLMIQHTNPFQVFAALGKTLWGLPGILKRRKPIPKQYVKEALGNKSEIANLYHSVRVMLSLRNAAKQMQA